VEPLLLLGMLSEYRWGVMNGAEFRVNCCYKQLAVCYLCESTFGKGENE